jgi:hypothetical protein
VAPPDRPRVLATATQMRQSNLKHLVAGLDDTELDDLMLRATRSCEGACDGRRLVPFTGVTETHRADGIDPTDLATLGNPGDLVSMDASAYGRALSGAGMQVRQCWVEQYAPIFQDMWSYTGVQITLLRGDGGEQQVQPSDLIGGGISPDTGHVWFRVGTYLPAGSLVRVVYGGGYDPIPQNLVQACRYMAAADVIDEDQFPAGPNLNTHKDGGAGREAPGYYGRALKLLKPWKRHS